ncbi:MAG: hypothetical protein M3N48_05380 [Verrucomicrobiota bacterium]|nr:hypothetical protein [Verrucomicrobiota bacterium]
MKNTFAMKRVSARYTKVPHVPGLYRQVVSGRYYGVKKLHGRRRERSLRTADRKIAERRLRDWVANLHRTDREKEPHEISATHCHIRCGESRKIEEYADVPPFDHQAVG